MSTTSHAVSGEATATFVERRVTLPDGRVMQVREYGDPTGAPVIALHGTPASRIMYALAGSRVGEFGLRILAPDRWGYGGTSAHPRPTLAAFAEDAAVLADQLELPRFAVLGVSGGGPYAVALAACLADRVSALALVAPVGPLAGVHLSPFHRFSFVLLPRIPGALHIIFGSFRRRLARQPAAAMRVAMVRSPEPDRRVLADPHVHRRFVDMFREGLRTGVAGALIDMQIFSKPWQVPIERITAPSALWIGTADNNVPLAAALGLAAAIPGCGLTTLAGEGHLWIALNYDGVLAWIAGNVTRAAATPPSRSEPSRSDAIVNAPQAGARPPAGGR